MLRPRGDENFRFVHPEDFCFSLQVLLSVCSFSVAMHLRFEGK